MAIVRQAGQHHAPLAAAGDTADTAAIVITSPPTTRLIRPRGAVGAAEA